MIFFVFCCVFGFGFVVFHLCCGRLWEACWYLRLSGQFMFAHLSTLAFVRPFVHGSSEEPVHSVLWTIGPCTCPFLRLSIRLFIRRCIGRPMRCMGFGVRVWVLGFEDLKSGLGFAGLRFGGLGCGVGVWGPCCFSGLWFGGSGACGLG